ncbi:30S ribosomal protein S27ae [Candidatus Pacearchaeota archaeon]|nr:MAG: 30S ribosomal protein S27ae [Candidatus Pacearchaeota archaeon]
MAGKKQVKKGKKPHKNKKTSKKYSKYKIDGEKVTKERFCPRCGPGVFLMKAKNRFYCGKCHYSEFLGKKETEKKEESKE